MNSSFSSSGSLELPLSPVRLPAACADAASASPSPASPAPATAPAALPAAPAPAELLRRLRRRILLRRRLEGPGGGGGRRGVRREAHTSHGAVNSPKSRPRKRAFSFRRRKGEELCYYMKKDSKRKFPCAVKYPERYI